ncbi:MAG TPA: response regulator transcription factor [Symbiobacteriaceae bacterium]|jgi:two-component system, NarL family, response regulator DevR|nr:response regulator transcription factor [Symbiobacteriaceae bacterium]
MPINVVLIDDHELLREGVRAALSRGTDMVVVGEATTGTAAIKICRDLRPDLVVLETHLPDMTGVEVCERLRTECPATRVLFLTASADGDLVIAAVQAGAKGFLTKNISGADLRQHCLAVSRGEVAIDSKLLGPLINQMILARDSSGEPFPLNPRQLAIIRLVAHGLTNREIADRLYLSEKTVKAYLGEALRRLGVKKRVEAALLASSKGWI